MPDVGVVQELLVKAGGHNYYITVTKNVRGRLFYMVARNTAWPKFFNSKHDIENWYPNLRGKLGKLK